MFTEVMTVIIVKINLENVCPHVADLEDDNISLINTKREEKKQVHKKVTTKFGL